MHEDFNKKHYPFVAAFKRDNKAVNTYIARCDPFDDEIRVRISKKNYPKEVQTIIENHCSTEQNYYEINKYSSLVADLETIGWKLN